MKKLLTSFFIYALLVNFTGCTTGQNSGKALYVSLSGNDYWSGKLPEQNADKTDGPFRTFEKARDAIRELKKAASLPDGGITVNIRGGIYKVTETFNLTSDDSGTDEAPVIWRAFPGEEVRFFGGKVITGFNSVDDPAVLNRIDKKYREKILMADLNAQGITDFGEIKSTGFMLPTVPAVLELFFEGKPMTIARYPNDGWLKIAGVPQTGEKLIYKGWDRDLIDGIPIGRHYGRFAYHGNRPERWAKADDIWLHGYWSWDWADSYVKVKKIDTRLSEIYTEEPHGAAGYTKYRRYFALNILEELDEPGEWYLDRENGKLYFWPPSRIDKGDTVVSMLEELMVSLEKTSYVTLQGIIFEYSRAGAIKIEGGSHNTVAGCIIRNIGNSAVIIKGGTHNGVKSCDIYYTGDGGVILSGGDRKTLTPANNYVANCHIHHYSRVNKTYRPAVKVEGVGNIISHNHIHDAPHAGIISRGNEHIYEFNEFHDLALETGDVGAIYTVGNITTRGTVIRHNYFHDIHGAGMFGAQSVYLDDFTSGITVYGNIFFRDKRAVFIGGGRYNTVENNIFVECEPSIYVDARGLNWASYAFDRETGGVYRDLKKFNYKEPPYSEKYPELLDFADDEPAVPKYNRILRNVSYGGRWMDIFWLPDISVLTFKDNIIADPELYMTGDSPVEDPGYADYIKTFEKNVTYKFGNSEIMEKLSGNILIETDPGFVDLKNRNFRLKENSPAWKLGFKPVPVEKIGLYDDEYRSSLPEAD